MSESSAINPCPCTKKKWIFLVVGILGLLGAYYGVYGKGLGMLHSGDHEQAEHAFRPMYSLLIGSMFWFSVLIGMLFMIMMTRIFDANWAPIIRRQWEHFVGALPFVLLLGVCPLLHPEVRKTVWEWMNPEAMLPNGHLVGHDSVLAAKSWYLNEGFFWGRIGFYFLLLTVVPYAFRYLSYKQDKDPHFKYTDRAHSISVGTMLFVALGVTALAIEFSMSLSYHWFSTMYGVWFFTVCIRAALAVTVLICAKLACDGWLKGLYNRAHMHVLGSMMLAFTVFWAYISFSQYFIIYNANIPEETFWYNMREFVPHTLAGVQHLADAPYAKNQWWWVSMGTLFGYFFLPFFALLPYKTKVVPKLLCATAVWSLLGGLLDLYFNIVPRQIVTAGAPENYLVNPFLDTNMIFDASAIIGLGGVVMFVFLHSASKQQPIPIHDPRVLDSVNYHE